MSNSVHFSSTLLCDSTTIMADTNIQNTLQMIRERTMFKSVVFILMIKEDDYINMINKLSRSGKCKVSDKEMTVYQNLLLLSRRTVLTENTLMIHMQNNLCSSVMPHVEYLYTHFLTTSTIQCQALKYLIFHPDSNSIPYNETQCGEAQQQTGKILSMNGHMWVFNRAIKVICKIK